MTREQAVAGRLSQLEAVFGKSGVIDKKSKSRKPQRN